MIETSRTLILVRHGHRDTTSGRQQDNGLSDDGQKQAKRIVRRFEKRFPNLSVGEPKILSSERRRCRETLLPLSEQLDHPITIHPALLEGSSLEAKIGQFIKEFRNAPESIWIACSHGDWIPEALRILIGAPLEVKKGSWAEIRFKNRETRLECFLQEP